MTADHKSLQFNFCEMCVLHTSVHYDTVRSHLSELQLSESSVIRTPQKIEILLYVKWKVIWFASNSVVSLIQTFQLSEHPLVPLCSDKWLPTLILQYNAIKVASLCTRTYVYSKFCKSVAFFGTFLTAPVYQSITTNISLHNFWTKYITVYPGRTHWWAKLIGVMVCLDIFVN